MYIYISGSVTTNLVLDLLGQDKGASKYTDILRKILKQMPTSNDSKVQLKSLQEVLKLGYNMAQKEKQDKKGKILKHELEDDSDDSRSSNESLDNSDHDDDDLSMFIIYSYKYIL
jgi:ABC-type Zn2+ transport system substrate-binding protein/surface adhesin